MHRYPPLLPFLVIVSLADWLLARTLTRLLIFLPKSPLLIAFYQGFTFAGQLSTTLASLLNLSVLLWIIGQHLRIERRPWLASTWIAVVVIGLIALFIPLPLGLMIAYRLLVLMAIAMEGWRAISAGETLAQKAAHAVPVLVLMAGGLQQGTQLIYRALSLAFLPRLSEMLFNLGEFLLVIGSVIIWWAYGRGTSWRVWLGSAVLPAGFITLYTANPALTGIIAIWSMGLTLYLPWVLYVFAIWLSSVSLLVLLRRGNSLGWAILLLAAGGYAPQSNTQALYGLIALWLLARNSLTSSQQTPNAMQTPTLLCTN